MKRQSSSVFLIQPNLRRLLPLCAVALALLASVRPALAQDLPAGKTAEQPKDGVAATAVAGLQASLGTAELSSPRSAASCPFVKCLITCDNGLGHTQYFSNTLACYSYSDGLGCHASGIFVCSDGPPRSTAAGC